MHNDILSLIIPYMHVRDVTNLIPNNVDYIWKMLCARDFPHMHIYDHIDYKQLYRKLYLIRALLHLYPYWYASSVDTLCHICPTVTLLTKMYAVIKDLLTDSDLVIEISTVYHALHILKMLYNDTQNLINDSRSSIMLFSADELRYIIDRMHSMDIEHKHSMYSDTVMLEVATTINNIKNNNDFKSHILRISKIPALCYYLKNSVVRQKYINFNAYELYKYRDLADNMYLYVGSYFNVTNYRKLHYLYIDHDKDQRKAVEML